MTSRSACLLFILLFNVGCAYDTVPTPDFGSLPLTPDRRKAPVAAMDGNIEIKAREMLGNDPIIPFQSHLNIMVYNGALLITGEILDESLHQSIIESIRIIPGVKRVQDETTIASALDPATISNDSRITNRILAAIDSQPLPQNFASTDVKITTENGNVYLMGLVYPDEADLVTRIAQKTPEVKAVVKLFEYLQ